MCAPGAGLVVVARRCRAKSGDVFADMTACGIDSDP